MEKNNTLSNLFPVIVIIACAIVSWIVYDFILGASSHFVDAAREKPKTGDLMGTMFEGGKLVPLILTELLMVLVFSVERILTLIKAQGRGNAANFVRQI